MTTRDAIWQLKTTIKELAATQKKEKASRKGYPVHGQSALWCAIYRRSSEITACLNFYLALRGKPYRHGAPDEYLDKRFTKELAEKFETAVKV